MSKTHRCEEIRVLMVDAWGKFGTGPFTSKDVFVSATPKQKGLFAGAFKAGWISPIERRPHGSVWTITPEGVKYAKRFV